MFDPDLPSNRLVYEVRKRPEIYSRFAEKLEDLMVEYGLGEREKIAWRQIDILALSELGVHPYFLPQISRLFKGSANNDSNSAAAQVYRHALVDRV
jgi:protocatechuate 4,5-dioxygenase alpha chain